MTENINQDVWLAFILVGSSILIRSRYPIFFKAVTNRYFAYIGIEITYFLGTMILNEPYFINWLFIRLIILNILVLIGGELNNYFKIINN